MFLTKSDKEFDPLDDRIDWIPVAKDIEVKDGIYINEEEREAFENEILPDDGVDIKEILLAGRDPCNKCKADKVRMKKLVDRIYKLEQLITKHNCQPWYKRFKVIEV